MQAPKVIFSGRQTQGQKLIRAWWENATDMWSKNIWLPISQYTVLINYFRLISYWEVQCWVQSPASSVFLQNMCFLSSIQPDTKIACQIFIINIDQSSIPAWKNGLRLHDGFKLWNLMVFGCIYWTHHHLTESLTEVTKLCFVYTILLNEVHW